MRVPVWVLGPSSGKIICWRCCSNGGVRGSGPEPPPRGIGAQHAGTALPPGVWDTRDEGRHKMAAMKPRTGDGPLEVTKEGRGIVMRVPLEGGGRLVVEMSADEANALGDALKSAAG